MLEHPLHPDRHLAQVVGRDIGRHTHGDTGAAIDEQVGESAREHHGLEGATVVIGGEVDSVLVDIPHHLHGQRRHTALGVALSRGWIVAHRPEIALALDKWITQRPWLGETDEGVVDRCVAVRVVAAHHVADDACGFGEVAVRAIAAVVHGVEHATMHRLESITHIRQRAGDDDAHGIVEVRALHLLLEVHGLDAPPRGHHVDVVGHVWLLWARCLGRWAVSAD